MARSWQGDFLAKFDDTWEIEKVFVLFTDFGMEGPYLGQMKAVLHHLAPGIPVIDLVADAPRFDPMSSAYLLSALVPGFPKASVFVTVVDPGVGSGRAALVLQADDRYFVGPDNGLLSIVARRAARTAWWQITWRPDQLSASFHGRDLFAPVAAQLARSEVPSGDPISVPDTAWPDDLAQIIYVDYFGNAVTGLRAAAVQGGSELIVSGKAFSQYRTFSDVAPGTAFWYENSIGLAEIAVNQGRADQLSEVIPGAVVSYTAKSATP